MTFDEWFLENAKHMRTADFEAWLSESWDAAVSAEREAIAKMFDDAPKLMPYAQNAEGGCLTCGFSPEYAAEAIRSREEK